MLGRENAVHVINQKTTQRAIFSEPRTWDQAVTVQAGETAHVNSIISQKQAYLLKNTSAPRQ